MVNKAFLSCCLGVVRKSFVFPPFYKWKRSEKTPEVGRRMMTKELIGLFGWLGVVMIVPAGAQRWAWPYDPVVDHRGLVAAALFIREGTITNVITATSFQSVVTNIAVIFLTCCDVISFRLIDHGQNHQSPRYFIPCREKIGNRRRE